MKIQIVDDSPEKIEMISLFLAERFGSRVELVHEGSIVGASVQFREESPEFLIVDLRLPTREGGLLRNDGGIEYLSSLEGYEAPNIRGVVGLTEFRDAARDCEQFFADRGWSPIFFEVAEDSWKDALARRVRWALNSDDGAASSPVEFGFVTALRAAEFRFVEELDCGWEVVRVENDSTTYLKGQIRMESGQTVNVVAASCFRMGCTAASILTAKLIRNFCPKGVFMVGLTGGIRGEVEIGDVLCGREVFLFRAGRLFESEGSIGFEPEPRTLVIDPRIEGLIDRICSDGRISDLAVRGLGSGYPRDPKTLRFGSLGCSDCVVKSEKTVDEVRKYDRKTLGIEMEAHGFMFAALHAGAVSTPALCCKGVCDFADSQKDDKHRNLAASLSALSAFNIVRHYGEDWLSLVR